MIRQRYSENEYRSNKEMLRLFKFGFPFMLFLSILAILSARFQVVQLLVITPLVLAASFLLSAAEIRVTDGVLEVRRLAKWQRLPPEEILGCRVALIPVMGRLKLRRFVPPWGAIYFILPGPTIQIAWPTGHTKFTALINGKRFDRQAELPTGAMSLLEGRRTRLARCGVGAVSGVLYTILFYTLVPESPLSRDWGGFPHWVRTAVEVEKLALGWPWGLLTCAFLAVAIFHSRFERRTWILTFAFGAIVANVVVNGLQ